jgi:hypothetical protein
MSIFLAVDKDGTEKIFQDQPKRGKKAFVPCSVFNEKYLTVPKGTMLRLIGRELTWEDEAEEVTDYKP